MSVLLSSITNTGQNDFITRSLLWSNLVKWSTPKFRWSLLHRLVWWSFSENGNHSTHHRLGYWSTAL